MRKAAKQTLRIFSFSAILVFLLCILSSCTQHTSAIKEYDSDTANNEMRSITILNYGEYLEFLSDYENTGDGKFVVYDRLREIGEFKSFTVYPVSIAKGFDQYRYTLMDPVGFSVNLTITDTSSEYYDEVYSKRKAEYSKLECGEIEDGHDMRLLNKDETGYLIIGEYEYMYVNGDLIWISTQKDGLEYRLSGESLLSSYPDSADTFVARLLKAKK